MAIWTTKEAFYFTCRVSIAGILPLTQTHFFTLACHFSSISHLCFFGVSPCIAQKLSLLMNYVPLKPFTIVYSKKTFLKIRFSFLFVRFLKPVFRFDIWVAKLSFSEQFFTFRNDSTCVWSEIYNLNVVPEKKSRLHKFRKKKSQTLNINFSNTYKLKCSLSSNQGNNEETDLFICDK